MTQTGFAVEGLQDLNRAFKRADRSLRLEWRRGQRAIAEPTRQAAQANAVGEFRNVGAGWSAMRTGVTQRVVYVAPKHRGTKDRRRRRPNFAGLLMERAMRPALEQHHSQILRDFDHLLATVGREWER